MSGIPNSFNIFSLTIHFYGLIIALGILIAIIFCYFLLEKRGIKKDLAFDLAIWGIPFGIFGARLFYVLFSGYSYTFVEALQIWNGGLSILGAITFGAIGVFIACRIKKISFIAVADCTLPGILLAQAIGRWGNFFNQEAYGPLITNTKFQWFPFGVNIDVLGGTEWHCATFFYESLWNIIGFSIMLVLIFKIVNKNKTGIVASIYFMWYGFGRFWIEQIRQDPLIIFESIRFSQLLAFIEFLIGCVVFIIILLRSRSKGVENVRDC